MAGMDLTFLVSQYRAVEILDALAGSPRTLRQLQHEAHACKRPLTGTLRLLAAHGLVTRCAGSGTWDRVPRTVHYGLTPAGRCLCSELSELDVWAALYEQNL